MIRKVFALFAVLTMASCHPAYANAVGSEITVTNCKVIKTLATELISDFQNGATQFEVMRNLNSRSMRDYGPNGENVKLYLQINVNAIHRNVAKAFKPAQIVNAIERDCTSKLGKQL